MRTARRPASAAVLAVLIAAGTAAEPLPERFPTPHAMVIITRWFSEHESPFFKVVCAGVVNDIGEITTAAHCLPSDDVSNLVVLPGTSNTCQPVSLTDRRSVASLKHVDRRADVAVLAVPGAIPPARPSAHAGPPALVAFGLGTGPHGTRRCSARPVRLTQSDPTTCASLRSDLGLPSSLLCATAADGEEFNTCSGDSGGPVYSYSPGRPPTLVGVTSSGVGCEADSVGFIAALVGPNDGAPPAVTASWPTTD